MEGNTPNTALLPWPVHITQHALLRAKQKFCLRTDEEAEAFLLQELRESTSTRKRRSGALRWTTHQTQLVTRQDAAGVHVLTCYPLPRRRGWTKQRKRTWRHEEHDEERDEEKLS